MGEKRAISGEKEAHKVLESRKGNRLSLLELHGRIFAGGPVLLSAVPFVSAVRVWGRGNPAVQFSRLCSLLMSRALTFVGNIHPFFSCWIRAWCPSLLQSVLFPQSLAVWSFDVFLASWFFLQYCRWVFSVLVLLAGGKKPFLFSFQQNHSLHAYPLQYLFLFFTWKNCMEKTVCMHCFFFFFPW